MNQKMLDFAAGFMSDFEMHLAEFFVYFLFSYYFKDWIFMSFGRHLYLTETHIYLIYTDERLRIKRFFFERHICNYFL